MIIFVNYFWKVSFYYLLKILFIHLMQICKWHNCHLAPYSLKSDKPFLNLSDWYSSPEQDSHLGPSVGTISWETIIFELEIIWKFKNTLNQNPARSLSSLVHLSLFMRIHIEKLIKEKKKKKFTSLCDTKLVNTLTPRPLLLM